MINPSILGITLEDGGRVQLWVWSPAASLRILGVFTPGSALGIAFRLMRDHPDLHLFTAQEAAALFADIVGPIR